MDIKTPTLTDTIVSNKGRYYGAVDGTRTRTVSLPGDFKSPVSTDSTTTAARVDFNTFSPHRQVRTDPDSGYRGPGNFPGTSPAPAAASPS